jgi:hypothetical protein
MYGKFHDQLIKWANTSWGKPSGFDSASNLQAVGMQGDVMSTTTP